MQASVTGSSGAVKRCATFCLSNRNSTEMRLPFTKMHGLGNDFVVLDAVTQEVNLEPHQIAALGDRHTGVGFDQLLIVAPPTVPEADFELQIYNTDGTRAEQCGNGTRCVALFVKRKALAVRETLNWSTTTGLISTRLDGDLVEVGMGIPSTAPADIPFVPPLAEKKSAEETQNGGHNATELDVCGQVIQVHPVSMGNPHGVTFVDQVATAAVSELGAALTGHEAFPEGANIGFCEVVDRGFVRLRVYERGVGETRACGSGACAAAVAGILDGRLNERVKVSLPGGKLRIRWQGGNHPVMMTGPASWVFEGDHRPLTTPAHSYGTRT